VKVSVAHVANGQIAGTGDLISLLTGDVNPSFASLLDLGESGHAAGHRDDGSRAKQGNRSKEKENQDELSPALRDSKPSSILNSPGLQTIPSVVIAPWQLESGDHAANEDAGDVSLSPSLATNDALQVRGRTSRAEARTVGAPASNGQQVLNENAAPAAPFPDLNDPELVEPSKGAIAKNQGMAALDPIAPPNSKGTKPVVAQSCSVTPGAVQPSSGIVGNGVQALIPQGDMDPQLVGISVAQRPTHPSAEAKPDSEGQSPAISAGERSSDLSGENVGGQVSSSALSQGVGGVASSSTAGGHSQGNGSDPHRGSSDAKEAMAVGHVRTPQTPESTTLAALGSGGSAHGHPALTNSTRLESGRESTPNTQLKDVTSLRAADANTARLLGSAMRGDLRVGVQTEAFGRVTIQTNAQGGQLSAQLSLENAKESATLAAHLPGVEQKIVQQHGLNASVRLVGGFDGGAGTGSMGRGESGAGRREAERYRGDVAMRQRGIERDSSNESRAIETALTGSRYSMSSRLDVTV
jgi:hypothetical protein